MYNALAKYYDGLVKDDIATQNWVSLIKEAVSGSHIMELACGSGEITLALAKAGYTIDASDLSLDMLSEAKQKDVEHLIHYYQMDMNEFHTEKKYQGILCLCDSINYLLQIEQLQALFEKVYEALDETGVFIFDMHSLDRLVEFQEEFYEAGIVRGQEYVWSIVTIDDCLHHNFVFYQEDGTYLQEQHIQRVFDPKEVQALLNPYFEVQVKTDFIQDGIGSGEKYFYICRKRRIG